MAFAQEREAFHAQQQALHAQQEKLHEEERARHAVELEASSRHLEELEGMAERLGEVSQQSLAVRREIGACRFVARSKALDQVRWRTGWRWPRARHLFGSPLGPCQVWVPAKQRA